MLGKNNCIWSKDENNVRLILYIQHSLAANLAENLKMALKKIGRKSNPELVKTVIDLKKASIDNDTSLWKSIASRLEGPTRNWPVVNITKLEFHAMKNAKVIVPGKLLGAGKITKKMTVTAFSFTHSAANKIEAAGGKCQTYSDFIKANPKGTNVVVIG